MRKALTGMAVLMALASVWAGLEGRGGSDNAPVVGTAQAAGDYYVIAEYDCVSDSDPRSSQGSCQIETHSTESCQAAMEAHRRDVGSRGDVCRRCVANVTDNTRHANGVHRFKQGGPCQGWQ